MSVCNAHIRGRSHVQGEALATATHPRGCCVPRTLRFPVAAILGIAYRI